MDTIVHAVASSVVQVVGAVHVFVVHLLGAA